MLRMRRAGRACWGDESLVMVRVEFMCRSVFNIFEVTVLLFIIMQNFRLHMWIIRHTSFCLFIFMCEFMYIVRDAVM